MFSIDLCDMDLLWILNFHFAHTGIIPHREGCNYLTFCLFSLLDSGEYFQEILADDSIEVSFH